MSVFRKVPWLRMSRLALVLLCLLLPLHSWACSILMGDCQMKSAFELEQIALTFEQMTPGSYDALIGSTLIPIASVVDKQVDISMNANVISVGYVTLLLHTIVDKSAGGSGQFRMVGARVELGVHLSQNLDVYLMHYSQHYLDIQSISGNLPMMENAVGIRWILYRANVEKGSLCP